MLRASRHQEKENKMDRTSPLAKANAWFLKLAENYMDRKYGSRKRAVFSLLPSTVVEIGAGTGANFRYYAPRTRVIAVEPNPAMHAPLAANAARWNIELEIRSLRGEEMDLPDGSVEAVVGTLVLCTVQDPLQVLSEVLRVLQPGGRYIFLEHVAAATGSSLRGLQNLLQKPWHWITEGCHLNRDTHRLLQEIGFTRVDMDCFMLRPSVLPVTPHVFGLAIK